MNGCKGCFYLLERVGPKTRQTQLNVNQFEFSCSQPAQNNSSSGKVNNLINFIGPDRRIADNVSASSEKYGLIKGGSSPRRLQNSQIVYLEYKGLCCRGRVIYQALRASPADRKECIWWKSLPRDLDEEVGLRRKKKNRLLLIYDYGKHILCLGCGSSNQMNGSMAHGRLV
ncbi:UNVERIFIED_CONTAM: hypothetical protein PYX00_003513 [Menopon gallinae]|uniref:Uncharacterized protein n=1 Tax=Menopon gallinae TaxID=328185 RepID=A0AAW2I276_9NEOP